MDVHYLHFDTIDSTNSWVKAHAHELDQSALTCVTADLQTKGRGRLGRQWVSHLGNLHMSLFLPMKQNDPRLPNLSQLLAYAAIQVFLSLDIPAAIKWPNDLIVEDKKVAGILVEVCDEGAILGIGININAQVEADQPTTYMEAHTHQKITVEKVRDKVVFNFLKVLEIPFSTLVPYFNQLLAFKNQKIQCKCDGKQVEGVLLGINDKGQLHLQVASESVFLSSGDISLLRRLKK